MSSVVKRRLVLIAKLAILALTVWFVHRSLFDAWRKLQLQIDAGDWSLAQLNWPLLVAAGAMYSLGQLPCALFWRRILLGLGQTAPLGAVLRAYYVGHLGKYVPGKALVIVLRSGLLARYGVKPGAATISVFYETFTMMAVGSAVAVVMLLWKFREQTTWLAVAGVMACATAAPTIPPLFEFILYRLRKRGVESAESCSVRRLGFGTLAGGWLIVALGWALMGLSIATTLEAAGFAAEVSRLDQWAVGTAAAALSIVLGFLSFIPVGLGVREAVLLTVLKGTYGEAGALVAAVLVRLVWLVSEVVVSAILYLWRTPESGPPQSTTDPRSALPRG
jgi:uncharacterized membrane protein YbhN (UPF0104 family)